MAGFRVLVLAIVAWTLPFAAHTAAASDAVPTDAGARTGRIVVGLPAGTDRDVSFTFGDGKVSIQLPAGATFPLDFERESNGLLRAGEVVPVDAGHVRLDLRLASGVVNAIDVSSTAVAVSLRRRFAGPGTQPESRATTSTDWERTTRSRSR